MALLLRKGTQARRYEEAFLRAGIPFVNLAGGNPFESPEALDIGNLLGWLADPEDQTLFTGLSCRRSSWPGRTCSSNSGARRAVTVPCRGCSSRAAEAVRQARGRKRTMLPASARRSGGSSTARDRFTIRELLEYAFSETGYTAAILADPVRGEESLAVVDAVLAAADGFERSGGPSSEFGELLRSGGLASERGATLETRGDALTIITIHKAKGLEYKAVFLADAASRTRGDTRTFLIHDTLGPAVSYRSPTGKKIESFALALAKESERTKALAESKRLFYVACTRAEDLLVITGRRPARGAGRAFRKRQLDGLALRIARHRPRNRPPRRKPRGTLLLQPHRGRRGTGRNRLRVLAAVRRGGRVNRIGTPRASRRTRAAAPAHLRKPATLSPTQVMDYLACPARYLLNRLYHTSVFVQQRRGAVRRTCPSCAGTLGLPRSRRSHRER